MKKIIQILAILTSTTLSIKICPWGNTPYCGVNHVTYPNECAIMASHIGILHEGPCTISKEDT